MSSRCQRFARLRLRVIAHADEVGLRLHAEIVEPTGDVQRGHVHLGIPVANAHRLPKRIVRIVRDHVGEELRANTGHVRNGLERQHPRQTIPIGDRLRLALGDRLLLGRPLGSEGKVEDAVARPHASIVVGLRRDRHERFHVRTAILRRRDLRVCRIRRAEHADVAVAPRLMPDPLLDVVAVLRLVDVRLPLSLRRAQSA